VEVTDVAKVGIMITLAGWLRQRTYKMKKKHSILLRTVYFLVQKQTFVFRFVAKKCNLGDKKL